MNHSTPGLPVHHQLPEFTQTHVHRFSDAIQPSHPLSSPSPPASNPPQHQSLCQWVNSSHEVAEVLEFQLQHHSFQRNPRANLLQNGLVGSPCSWRDSKESSPTPEFKSINSSACSFPHSPTFTSIKKKLVLGQVPQFRVSLSRESLSLQFRNLKSWLADPLGLKSKSRGECFKIYKRSAVGQQTLWVKKTNENKVGHGNMIPPPQSTKLCTLL